MESVEGMEGVGGGGLRVGSAERRRELHSAAVRPVLQTPLRLQGRRGNAALHKHVAVHLHPRVRRVPVRLRVRPQCLAQGGRAGEESGEDARRVELLRPHRSLGTLEVLLSTWLHRLAPLRQRSLHGVVHSVPRVVLAPVRSIVHPRRASTVEVQCVAVGHDEVITLVHQSGRNRLVDRVPHLEHERVHRERLRTHRSLSDKVPTAVGTRPLHDLLERLVLRLVRLLHAGHRLLREVRPQTVERLRVTPVVAVVGDPVRHRLRLRAVVPARRARHTVADNHLVTAKVVHAASEVLHELRVNVAQHNVHVGVRGVQLTGGGLQRACLPVQTRLVAHDKVIQPGLLAPLPALARVARLVDLRHNTHAVRQSERTECDHILHTVHLFVRVRSVDRHVRPRRHLKRERRGVGEVQVECVKLRRSHSTDDRVKRGDGDEVTRGVNEHTTVRERRHILDRHGRASNLVAQR
eukprot:Rhum_TRINITY_DN15362_c5_g1::Rhum_TRINITY_DN15362_c5_g1_i1::g.153325::m.153325